MSFLLYPNDPVLSVGAPNNPSGSVPPPQLNLTQIASDNFNRANGAIAGANNWLATSEGSMSISSNELIGVATPAQAGNYRTNETYNPNQFAQCSVGSVALPSGQYYGVSVRNQDNQNNYTGIYFNSAGQFVLALYKKTAGNYIQLGTNVIIGASPLALGTVLQLVAEGSQITFSVPSQPTAVGGITLVDTTFTTGVPGVESFGAGSLDNWVGGNAATAATGATLASDNFNRANNGVSVGQPNWTVMAYSAGNVTPHATSDATIVTNQIVDSINTAQHEGDVRTDSYNSDHWSAIQIGTVAVDTTGFAMATIRNQNGGNAGYIGGCFHNNSYQIYRLDGGGVAGGGASTLLGGLVTLGSDPAGTEYRLVGKGSRISLRIGGFEVLAVTDANYSGGAPGLMNYGNSSSDNWSGGNT